MADEHVRKLSENQIQHIANSIANLQRCSRPATRACCTDEETVLEVLIRLVQKWGDSKD